MRTARWLIASIVVLVLLVVGIGYALPVRHRASRMALYSATPDSIFGIITNSSAFPRWRTGMISVENIKTSDSSWSYREKGKDGDVLYVVEDVIPSQRIVTRIADKSLPFGGKWTYELTPSARGAWLRITEDGEVYNPVFRFMSNFVIGQTATIEMYLNDLGRKLGEKVSVVD